ncbi:MAG: cysteine desulfurase family protein, partial [Pseudomonadota bacterium]
RTYLDYNATAPLLLEAREMMLQAMDVTGNPSSVHGEGRDTRKLVEDAREKVAVLVGTKPNNVVFTSGATEANAWALARNWDQILLSRIEHDSVLAPARSSGGDIMDLDVDPNGQASVEQVADFAYLNSIENRRRLVALQMANNETGSLQPVEDAGRLCQEHGLSLHIDAVQAAGRTTIDFDALGADTLAISSHKIGGPMGVGALVIKDGLELSPFIVGGGQEKRRRAGTENVPGIVGFGAAAEFVVGQSQEMTRLGQLRDVLEKQLLSASPDAVIIGRDGPRIANTSCVAVTGQSSDILLIKFDLAGVAVSAGSACSSGKVGASHVLTAMGVKPELARGAIRISLGWNTSANDIETFIRSWSEILGGQARAVA